MPGTVVVRMMGRFGNQLLQYAFARSYAERHGLRLETGDWIGPKIFDIPPAPQTSVTKGWNIRNEDNLAEGEGDVILRSYFQQQKCMTYTRRDCREWFRFRPEIAAELAKIPPDTRVVGHRRVGDYPGYGYPVVSLASYAAAAEPLGRLTMVTEENPASLPAFAGWADFLPDFWRLCRAEVLLRGNSTFSWWAGVLGDGETWAPVVEGLTGGMEHDCLFIKGNHPRFTTLPNVTDLELSP